MMEITDKIKELFSILDKYNLKISSVESFTGGLFSSSITSVPGSSKYFEGCIVSYDTQIKIDLLKIDESIVKKYTVVSKEVADLMAINGRKLLKSDICISFTGNAGPTVCDGDKEVGLIYYSICYKDKTYSFSEIIKLERNLLRERAVFHGIEKIIKIILENN